MPIKDVRTLLADAAASLSAEASAAMSTAADALKLASAAYLDLGSITVTFTGPVSLNLAPVARDVSVAGAKVGDRVYVHQNGAITNAGIAIINGVGFGGTAYVPTDGTVRITFTIPAILLTNALVIPLKLVGARPTA